MSYLYRHTGGNEGAHQPNPIQRKYAKLFADEGVDVVLGTHPHVIQPVEWIKGKDHHRTLVAYSLGNFLNGQETGNISAKRHHDGAEAGGEKAGGEIEIVPAGRAVQPQRSQKHGKGERLRRP